MKFWDFFILCILVEMLNNQENGEKTPSKRGSGGGGGATRSCGTMVSGQSVSTSSSVGSPTSRSEAAVVTPASEITFAQLNNLDIHGDDARPQEAAG